MDIKLKNSDSTLRVKFGNLRSVSDIADMLEVKVKMLEFFLNRCPDVYRETKFKKKDGESRKILIPNSSLKILQSKFLYILNLHNPKRKIDPVHGFRKGRSILTNAKVHLGSTEVINFDLKDFFPSVNFGRVRGLFLSSYFGFNNEVATTLSKLCCYENELPQGAPTSPFIANLITFQLDGLMMKFSRKYRVLYTRYADDITLSSKRDVLSQHCYHEGNLWVLSSEIQSLVLSSGFEINNKKTRYRNINENSNERLEVTNIIINEKLNIPRKYIRQVRSILHNWKILGEEEAQKKLTGVYAKVGKLHKNRKTINLKKVVAGKLNFIKFVRGENDKVYRKYANEYLDLSGSSKPKYDFDLDAQFEKNTIVIQTGTGEKIHSAGFYIKGVGIITAAHVINGQSNIKYGLPDANDFKNAVVMYKNIDKDFALLLPAKALNDMKYSNFTEDESLLKTPYILGKEIGKKGAKYRACGYSNYTLGMEAKLGDCTITNVRPVGSTSTYIVQEIFYPGDSGGPVFDFTTGQIVGMSIRGGSDPNKGAGELLPTEEIRKEIEIYRNTVIRDLCNTIIRYSKI